MRQAGDSVPIAYEINQSQKLLVTRAVGAIGDVDVQTCIDRIRRDARFSDELDQLGDYRGVTSTDDITVEFLRECGKQWQLAAGARRAYIAHSTATLGILRVLEVFIGWGTNHVRVFHTLEDALGWLGRSPTALLPAMALADGARHQTARQRQARECNDRIRMPATRPTRK